jgi:hypothetical protein
MSTMQTIKLFSSAALASRGHSLRDEAAATSSMPLGDPKPGSGRSALDQLRARTPEPAKPFSISAHRGDDGSRAGIERAARIREVAKRLRRNPGPNPGRAARESPPCTPAGWG